MSKIEWTEKTWNPITGCTKISAGCKNCYAESIAKRFWNGRKFGDIRYHKERLKEPFRRKKPTIYFVNSMSDLFHEKIPFDKIAIIFEVMRLSPIHTFQVLTKRPENAVEFFKWWYKSDETAKISSNIWLGVSVENQETADQRLKFLKEFPSLIKFVSYEPALERVDFVGYEFINWIICGGESGAKKRPCNLNWFREVRDWAKRNDIAFFMKQIDKKKQIPDDLFIREYPTNFNVKELKKKLGKE